jgi:hypothetical protein
MGWTIQFSYPGRGKRFFSLPQHPDQFWTLARVPGAVSLGSSGQEMRLTTHLHIVPRIRICGAIPSLPLYVLMNS